MHARPAFHQALYGFLPAGDTGVSLGGTPLRHCEKGKREWLAAHARHLNIRTLHYCVPRFLGESSRTKVYQEGPRLAG
jgi:hypothetical protein